MIIWSQWFVLYLISSIHTYQRLCKTMQNLIHTQNLLNYIKYPSSWQICTCQIWYIHTRFIYYIAEKGAFNPVSQVKLNRSSGRATKLSCYLIITSCHLQCSDQEWKLNTKSDKPIISGITHLKEKNLLLKCQVKNSLNNGQHSYGVLHFLSSCSFTRCVNSVVNFNFTHSYDRIFLS